MQRRDFLLNLVLTFLFTVSVATACIAGHNTAANGQKTLVLATSADYPPYEFVDSSTGNQEIIGKSGSAIAFPQGSPLVAEFDPVITTMKNNGTIEELIVKWFGENSPTNQQSAK